MQTRLRGRKSYRNDAVFGKQNKGKPPETRLVFGGFGSKQKVLFPEVLCDLVGLCFGLA